MHRSVLLVALLVLGLGLASCGGDDDDTSTAAEPTATPTAVARATSTPAPPTATTIPPTATLPPTATAPATATQPPTATATVPPPTATTAPPIATVELDLASYRADVDVEELIHDPAAFQDEKLTFSGSIYETIDDDGAKIVILLIVTRNGTQNNLIAIRYTDPATIEGLGTFMEVTIWGRQTATYARPGSPDEIPLLEGDAAQRT